MKVNLQGKNVYGNFQKKGWFKWNFNGASRGNPGKAGIGCFIHNEKGEEIANIENYIAKATNNWEEISALVEGLLLCKQLGINNLEIEGESAIIINVVRKLSFSN